LELIDAKAGELVELETEKPSSLRAIRARVKREIEGGILAAGEFDALPEGVPPLPGVVYTYLNLTSDFSEAIENAEIEFDVSKGWLEQTRVNKEGVSLLKLNEDWETLPTRIAGENETSVRYSARVPGFSVFAVVGVSKEVPPLGVSKEVPPPFPALFFLTFICLLGLGVWWAKRRRRSKSLHGSPKKVVRTRIKSSF
jgi:PGF-pre-PGF domain-containing protein